MKYNYVDVSMKRDKILINEKFDFLLQEIDILFDTIPGEVLGEDTFGTEFENFIWDLNISNRQISEYITEKIKNNTLTGSFFDIKVDTSIMYGTQNDIILVKIHITDPDTQDQVSTTYKII